jgi:hypothetical protein
MQFVSPLEHELRLPNSSLLAIRDRRFHSLLTACFLCLLIRRFAPVKRSWSARSGRDVFPGDPQGSALRQNFTSLWPEASAEARGLARSGPPATIEEPDGQTKQPAPQALPTNNADPQVGVGGLTDGGRGTGPGVNRPHRPSRLFVVGLLALPNPQVGVVGVVGCARAGDNLLHFGQGVAVGGQEPQVIAAGYAVPVVGPVIAGGGPPPPPRC